jgi:hypothetical protein
VDDAFEFNIEAVWVGTNWSDPYKAAVIRSIDALSSYITSDEPSGIYNGRVIDDITIDFTIAPGSPTTGVSVGSHWSEAVFGNEVLTGGAWSWDNELSYMTIAALGDFGYDVVSGANYTPPSSFI